jgi:hypothetical protein
MQPKRHTYTHLHSELLRWLGYVGLLLFVPGGIPIALLLLFRQHKNLLTFPKIVRYTRGLAGIRKSFPHLNIGSGGGA